MKKQRERFLSILQIRASFLCLSFFITALLRIPGIPLCSGVFQVLEAGTCHLSRAI